MNSRFNYEAAVEHLKEVIAACVVGPNSPEDKAKMVAELDAALARYETAKDAMDDDDLTFPEV